MRLPKLNFIFLIGFIIFVGLLILRGWIVYSKGTNLGGIEQNVIYNVQCLLNGTPLYTSPSTPPFSITQYTPLYYYINALTARITGLGPDDVRDLYIIGRIWNILYNLGTAWVIFQIASGIFGLSRLRSWILCVASFGLMYDLNFAVRPDSLCDMLGAASIYCFLRNQAGPRSFTLLALAVLLSALATFSKQSGIQVILIYGAFCLLTREWRTLISTILLSVVIYGAMLGWCLLKYPSYLENVVGGVANGISLSRYFNWIIFNKHIIITVWPLTALVIYLCIRNRTSFTQHGSLVLLASFAVGTLAFATATAVKSGASAQYYVLFVNLAMVLVMIGLSHYHYGLQPYQAYLLLSVAYFVHANWALIQANSVKSISEKRRKAASMAASFIEEADSGRSGGYVLVDMSEASGNYAPDREGLNNILFRNCLVPQMDIMEFSTVPVKVFGYAGLNSMLRAGKIRYIIENGEQSTHEAEVKFNILPDLPQELKQHYILAKGFDGYDVYKWDSK